MHKIEGRVMNCKCVDTSKNCLNVCEQTIHKAQALIAKCGGIQQEGCLLEIGEVMEYAQKCLQACHDIITHNKHYIERTKEKESIYIAEEAIAASEKTIASIEQVLGICKSGKSECIEACNVLIEACSNSAEACRKCIAMGI